MHIYFGKIHDLELFDGAFEHNDEHYLYAVEFGSNPGGTEDVVIKDSVGRATYIDSDSIEALIEALEHVNELRDEAQSAQKLLDYIYSNKADSIEY